MRGGGDEDVSALYQDAVQLHNEEMCAMANKFETLLIETVQDKNRHEQNSNQEQQISNLGRLKVKCTFHQHTNITWP